MSSTRTWYLLTALALVLAAVEPSSADSRANAPDYWNASKASLQKANTHRRLNETQAACEALAKSLDYYRMALAKDEFSGHAARHVNGKGGDAMQEIRSHFGCTGTQVG